ncbi:MAG: Gfo/Idh/MocA family oxidoreductase [Zavarzinella sp.]
MAETDGSVDRRRFLEQTATAGSAMVLAAESYARVVGANNQIRVGFLGCGGRAQAHINAVLKLKKLGLSPVAVCDVWDGLEDTYYQESPPGQRTRRNFAQGLYPSARKCGLNPKDTAKVTKEYRRIVDRKDVDLVVIATPDHWHARMALDAMAAGKDMLIERPMARTATEAFQIVDAAHLYQRIVAVGVQSMADPGWEIARNWISQHAIGPMVHLQTGMFHNDIRGEWRYYRIAKEMTSKTVDWQRFLGPTVEGNSEKNLPFNRATFAQWRCNRQFSGGPLTEWLVPKITPLLSLGKLTVPRRVMTSGGLFWQHDGRTVPDLVTVCADFEEGYQLQFTATTISSYPTEEVVRGRLGTVKFTKGNVQLFEDNPLRGNKLPNRLEQPISPTRSQMYQPNDNDSLSMWENFIDCIRSRNSATLCPPELGAVAVTIAHMAERSYRTGMPVFWDSEHRQLAGGDNSWAERWDIASKQHQRGAGLMPPDYQSLAED